MKKIVPCTISMFLLFSVLCIGNTIHVPMDQPSIQEGIDVANNGDTVLVAPGTYFENIRFNGKAIEVKSSDGAEHTIINGNNYGSVVTFEDNEPMDAKLDGFTLRNGLHAFFGGGIYCKGARPTIVNNIIIRNETLGGPGGGIYCVDADPSIFDNVISNNVAKTGGGIWNLRSNPMIVNNIIKENRAEFYGGGITCLEESNPTVMGNSIRLNSANYGGGVYCRLSQPSLIDNSINNNEAIECGGGCMRKTAGKA